MIRRWLRPILTLVWIAVLAVTTAAAPDNPPADFGSTGALITVTFADAQGKTDGDYSSYVVSVRAGDKVTLPQVPYSKGRIGEGWALQAGAARALYQPGMVLTITEQICFYAVQSQTVTATFIGSGGKTVGTLTVKKGRAITFPSLKNTARYSFLGWHTQKGKHSNPKYLVGETRKLNKDTTFYAVWYNRTAEKVPAKKDILLPDAADWRRVVFVGDSRMVHTRVYLKKRIGKTVFNSLPLTFLAKSGIMLEDFIADEEGEQKLIRLMTRGDTSRPAALVYNLGINELRPGADVPSMAAFAIRFLMNLRWKLDPYNVRFYIMSVNPVNDRIATRRQTDIIEYNRLLRIGTIGAFDYIDTFSWLNRTGYTTLNDQGEDDGLHYSAATSLRIFDYVMRSLQVTT